MDPWLWLEWFIKAYIMLMVLLTGFAYLTWYERRPLARIQTRVGPNRAGPFGLLQPIADAVKLIFKEELTPSAADKILFVAAPIMTVVPAMLLAAVIPLVRLDFDEKKKRYVLKKGRDEKKDQSYVLFSLTQNQLRHALFPLGGSRKEDVRKRAFQLGLRVDNKPDSQEVCFIEENSYQPFLMERWGNVIKPGPIVDRKGNVLGEHKGIPFYTIGQRRGLRLARGRPLYVIGIDRDRNAVIVGEEKEVYGETFIVDALNWIPFQRVDLPLSARVKIRYNHPGSEAVLSSIGEDITEP